jgi:hypothetical protein
LLVMAHWVNFAIAVNQHRMPVSSWNNPRFGLNWNQSGNGNILIGNNTESWIFSVPPSIELSSGRHRQIKIATRGYIDYTFAL